jgi:dTDP-4-amino-4,6-dideoxygalactose transaminase
VSAASTRNHRHRRPHLFPAGDEAANPRPLRETLLRFSPPDIADEDVDEVLTTLRSGWLARGSRARQFEEGLRTYIGCRHAIAVNSCSAGLELCLEAMGIGPGDEVITTPLTFCATAHAIVHRGARPVFVDVEPDTGNLDPRLVRKSITQRTRAILPVHLYGRPCRMDGLTAIARENCVRIIEDCAHALGARWDGRSVGARAEAAVFSFYSTKNLTTGDGGLVATEDDELADRIRGLMNQGISTGAHERDVGGATCSYDVTVFGHKGAMSDLTAALGLHQIAKIEMKLAHREVLCSLYDRLLSRLDGLVTPLGHSDIPQGARHARHLYPVLLDVDRLGTSRDEFVHAMGKDNIRVSFHYPALHLTTAYRQLLGLTAGALPVSERLSERLVSLPLSNGLATEDVRDVVQAVQRFVSRTYG